MEHKSHKKLYKSGKLWVAATIATSAMAGMALSQNVAHADTLNLTPVEKTADTQLPPVPETSYAKAAQQNVENTPATVGTPQPTFNAPSAQAAQPAKDTLPVDAVEGLSAQELQELHDRQSQPEVQATNATTTNQVADAKQAVADAQKDVDQANQTVAAKQAAVTKAEDAVKKAQVVPEIKVSDAYVKTVKQLEADLNAYANKSDNNANQVARRFEGYGSTAEQASDSVDEKTQQLFKQSAVENGLVKRMPVPGFDKEYNNNYDYQVVDSSLLQDDQRSIDVSNLTEAQQEELSAFVAALVNQVREKIGVTPLKVSKEAIDLTNREVKLADESGETIYGAYIEISKKGIEEYGLVGDDSIFSNNIFEESSNPKTMGALKNDLYKMIVAALFTNRFTGEMTNLLHDTFALKDADKQMYLGLAINKEGKVLIETFSNASYRTDKGVKGLVTTKATEIHVPSVIEANNAKRDLDNARVELKEATNKQKNANNKLDDAKKALDKLTTLGTNTNTDETTTTNGDQQSTVDTNEGLQERHDQQSEGTVTDVTNKGQVTVAKAGTKAVKSATTKQVVSAVKAQPARAAQAKALPQTGNDNANASVLGLAGVAMLSMIGLAAKRKF